MVKRSLRRSFSLFKQPRSLRTRLSLWNVLIIGVALIIWGTIIYVLVTSYLQTGLDRRLDAQGAKLQGITQAWLTSGSPVNDHLFQQLVESMQVDEYTPDPLYIKLFEAGTGLPLRYSPNLQQIHMPSTTNDLAAAAHGERIFTTYQGANGQQVRILTMPLIDNGHHTIAIAQIGRSLASVQQVQEVLFGVLLVGSVCVLLVVYGVSFLLVRREIQPLSSISKKMSTLSVQGLGVVLGPERRVIELQLLTDAFNQMSQRLEASFTLQRNFVGDVSHELRTPLTAVRGQIDVLLMNPQLDEEARQDVQQIRAELVRLSHLVNNLLVMARVDAGILPEVTAAGMQRVELDLLLVEIARQSSYLNPRVTLELGELQQLCVLGDTDMLRQMLLNIIDNALTYTPAGGQVTLSVTAVDAPPDLLHELQVSRSREWALLQIRDTGPGIHAQDLPHIFERHYRATQAIMRSKLGAGIGLSLARLIARAHEGEITVGSEVGKGSCFHIWLPVYSSIAEKTC